MEPRQDPRAHDLSPEAPTIPGELVVQNGRLSGTRCPLRAPLTLIGRGEDCDIRVNVDGVDSLHCAIALGPEGVSLRRLHRKHETRVNGQLVSTASLKDGDSITVGPCRFQLRLSPAEENHPEKDALRIQAAAVAAQQAALFEEETRLQQRRVTLERQEKELVAHLEEKRSRFLEAQSQLRRSHAAMQQEWARYEQRVAAMTRRLEVERRDVADSRRQVQAERRRLLQLRQRMKRRWHRFWAAERAAMQRKEQSLQQQAHRLEQDKGALLQARQRFHGAAELERRQLQEQWDELRQEQKRWEQQYIRERAELAEQSRSLEQRETHLAAAERSWAQQKQHLEATRAGLEREIHGLENRIRHQRQQLRAPQSEPNWFTPHEPTPAPAPTVQLVGPVAAPHAPVDESLSQRWAVLAAVAGELADQRLHLLEHWQRLIQTHQHWQQEREAVTAELEAQALRLQEREQALDQAVERCRRRHDEILHLQRLLDSRQAQLTVQALAWAAERDRGRADIQARAQNLERQLGGLDQRRQLWQQRQRQGLAQLRAAYALCARLREEYGLLRRQWLRRTEALVDNEKKLTQRALVLEQYRQKYLDRASDPAEAGKRLENLQQRASALFSHVDERLRQHRQSLQAEIARLEERHRFVDQAVEKVIAREAELCEREGAWEHQQALTEHEAGRFRQEIQRLQNQQEVAEQQVADLRNEVEHLARQILAEEDCTVLSVHQAA